MEFDFENDQRAIRRFLNLRLPDLERATGIAAARIGASERGVLDLHPAEQRIVTNYLREKLADREAAERDQPPLSELERAAFDVDEADREQCLDGLLLAKFHRENIAFRNGPIPPEVGNELARLVAQQKNSFARFQNAMAYWSDLKKKAENDAHNGNQDTRRMLLALPDGNGTVHE